MESTKHYYATADELTVGIEKLVVETDVVLDIGCGIAPINYFRPVLHLMVEPWKEYAEILSYRHQQDKSVIILSQGALEALKQLQSNSVDSIFLIDVIEHMDKEVGEEVIVEMERVARRQIVLFTPLGFMPQHIEHGEKDGWGLGGAEVQEHKSGWLPEDFSADWEFHICETYHDKDYNGQPLENVYGAFYAIRNFENVEASFTTPKSFSEIRRPLPSEIELEVVKSHKADLEVEISKLSESLTKSNAEIDIIKSNWLYKLLVKVNMI